MGGFDHFALIAPFYDRIFAGHNVARLAELLALPAGRLLDVGGGTGRITKALAALADLTVVADPSLAMLAGTHAKPGLWPTRGYAERLPFPDNSFDRVLVVDAFHHFCNQEEAARELVRVVAPGGRLVVQEMNYDRMPVKLIALGEKVLLMGSRFYRPGALRGLFEAPGCQVMVHADETINVWVVVEKAGG